MLLLGQNLRRASGEWAVPAWNLILKVPLAPSTGVSWTMRSCSRQQNSCSRAEVESGREFSHAARPSASWRSTTASWTVPNWWPRGWRDRETVYVRGQGSAREPKAELCMGGGSSRRAPRFGLNSVSGWCPRLCTRVSCRSFFEFQWHQPYEGSCCYGSSSNAYSSLPGWPGHHRKASDGRSTTDVDDIPRIPTIFCGGMSDIALAGLVLHPPAATAAPPPAAPPPPAPPAAAAAAPPPPPPPPLPKSASGNPWASCVQCLDRKGGLSPLVCRLGAPCRRGSPELQMRVSPCGGALRQGAHVSRGALY